MSSTDTFELTTTPVRDKDIPMHDLLPDHLPANVVRMFVSTDNLPMSLTIQIELFCHSWVLQTDSKLFGRVERGSRFKKTLQADKWKLGAISTHVPSYLPVQTYSGFRSF